MIKQKKHVLAKKQPISEGRMFDIIKHPLVTEKTTMAGEHNQYGFVVANDANKDEIKQAVEKIFKVAVTAVNTLVQDGKKKRFKGRFGQRSDFKKAYVTLKNGQTLDVSTGV